MVQRLGKSFVTKPDGTYTCLGSTEDRKVVPEAIEIARETGQFTFEHSGVIVTVEGGSNPGHILRDMRRARSAFIAPTVGPHPTPELSQEEIKSDERFQLERDLKYYQLNARTYADLVEATKAKLAALK